MNWLRNNSSTVWSWAALIAGALIVFALTWGTQYRQLGIALLAAAVTLLVLMAVFEAIWHVAVKMLEGQQPAGDKPKSGQRRR